MTELSKNIYELFDQFLETTVVNHKNLFPLEKTNSQDIFNEKNLTTLVDRYVIDFIGSVKDDQNAKTLLDSLKINGKKDDKLSFIDKIEEQFKATNIFGKSDPVSNEAKNVFGHLMWLQYLPANGKPWKDQKFGADKCEIIRIVTGGLVVSYPCDGLAKYGMASFRLDEDMTDLVLLFYTLVKNDWSNKDVDDVKKYILKWCLNLEDVRKNAYNDEAKINDGSKRKYPEDLLPIHNMLLHLCEKKYYDDISVTGHKAMIVEAFKDLIPMCKQRSLDLSKADMILDDDNNYNKQYYIICNEINKLQLPPEKQPSYEYKPLWGNQGAINHSVRIYDYKDIWSKDVVDKEINSTDDYSPINALRFKKAIILYGPPGTSKTYSAKKMAKTIIFKEQNPQPSIKDLFNNNLNDQIHRLQLHPNYTYEDFIWGYQIENEVYKENGMVCVGNKMVAKKGYFLRLLDEMKNDPSKTHVLILDEINRVDLSRLFGELFSAIENRNESIELPVRVEGIKSIRIPDNLYIIGTMNEIDFSLERVDFALRRRFAWSFYGYNKDTLESILEDKLVDFPKFDDNTRAEYVQYCTNLNKKIDEDPDLGEQYQIGHTFFAELVDIWKDMPNKKIKFLKTILWNISISPMIKAYLGNCNDKKLDPFRVAFGIDPLIQKNKKDGTTN